MAAGVPSARRRGRRRRPTRPTSIHDIVRVEGAGPGPAASCTTRYERRSGLVRFLRSTPRRRTGRGREATELGDAVDGRVRRRRAGSATGASWPGATPRSASAAVERHQDVDRSAATGARRPSSSAVELRASRRTAGRRPVRHRVDADDARRRRQPVGLVGGRRRSDSGHDTAGGAAGLTTHRSGQRLHRRGGDDHGRRAGGRLVRAGRDRSRTRRTASSASTRAAGCCSRGRSISRPGETAATRASSMPSRPPTTGRAEGL